MSITKRDIQQAIRISREVQHYIELTNGVNLRSTDVFPYLVRRGLFERDENNGVHFRRYLKSLHKGNMLESLIPQCKFVPPIGSQAFGEWYFNDAKDKMAKVIKDQIEVNESPKEEPMSLVIAEEMIQMMLEGINPITEESLNDNDICMHPRVQEALNYIITPLNHENTESPIILYKTNDSKPLSTVDTNKQLKDYSQNELEDKVIAIRTEIQGWAKTRDESKLGHVELKVRKKHPRAYEHWTKREKELLIELYDLLEDKEVIARILQRTLNSIDLMLKNLKRVVV